jgi:hypothetical protein
MSTSPAVRDLPTLPVTFRPRRARSVLAVLAVVVMISLTALAIMLPAPRGAGMEGFNTSDRIGFLLLALIIVGGMARLARPRVVATEEGLEVVNVARRHRLEWAQVVAVRMRPGDAWMVLDLDDGTVLNAMGVQAADGDFGRSQAMQVAALVAARSATTRDD